MKNSKKRRIEETKKRKKKEIEAQLALAQEKGWGAKIRFYEEKLRELEQE